MKPRIVALSCLAALLAARPVGAADEPPLSPTEITCDHFESKSTDAEMTTLCTGNVVVTGTNIRLTCDRLDVVSVRFGAKDQIVAKQNQFKSLIATGHVKIVQGEREATCGRAVVLPGDDKITLTEKPMVVDHGANATWIGDDLELLRGERQVTGNHVRMILPPVKDLGFDKNKKLEPAATPAITVPEAAKATPPGTK